MKDNGYAQALFSLACEDQEVLLCFDAFKAFMDNYPGDFKAFFTSPIISKNDKKAVIEKAFANTYVNFIYFIKVIIDNNRELLLEEIYADFQELVDEYQKIKRVLVISSDILSAIELMRIQKSLEAHFFGYQVEINNKVREDLLAGYQIYINNERIDMSLLGQLNKLKNEL